MPKKAAGKRPGSEGAAGATDAASTGAAAAVAEASARLGPRAARQRVWAKRADDAVLAMQQVQQLLQQHAAGVDSAKQSLEQVTATATSLWTLDVDELPSQYRDKSRPASQRIGSAASGRGGSAGDQRSSSKHSQRAGNGGIEGAAVASTVPSTAAAGTGNSSGGEATAPETVESVIRQLTLAQRGKASSALQTLFFAPVTDAATTAVASLTSASPSSIPEAADGDPPVPSENGRKVNNSVSTIPTPLLTAMKELQVRRVQLEVQLTAATTATAQQLQRFQLLQEESMVSRYALEALRNETGQPLVQS